MKKTFLIVLLPICFMSCIKRNSRAWTEAYYNKMYDSIYQINSTIIKDDSERKLFTAYEIKRLKTELPNGFSSVSDDSLSRIFSKLGKDYAKTHDAANMKAALPWTEETERSLKESFADANNMKKLNKATKEQLCNCLVMKLKEIYPDSLRTPIPDSISEKVANSCIEAMTHNKKK